MPQHDPAVHPVYGTAPGIVRWDGDIAVVRCNHCGHEAYPMEFYGIPDGWQCADSYVCAQVQNGQDRSRAIADRVEAEKLFP